MLYAVLGVEPSTWLNTGLEKVYFSARRFNALAPCPLFSYNK